MTTLRSPYCINSFPPCQIVLFLKRKIYLCILTLSVHNRILSLMYTSSIAFCPYFLLFYLYLFIYNDAKFFVFITCVSWDKNPGSCFRGWTKKIPKKKTYKANQKLNQNKHNQDTKKNQPNKNLISADVVPKYRLLSVGRVRNSVTKNFYVPPPSVPWHPWMMIKWGSKGEGCRGARLSLSYIPHLKKPILWNETQGGNVVETKKKKL